MKWIAASLLLLSSSLFSFEGLQGKYLDLLSLFLPSNPRILIINGYPKEAETLSQKWPEGQILRERSPQADLIWAHAEDLYTCPNLQEAKAIYVDTFEDLSLEKNGFILIYRRIQEGARQSLIFVKKDYFYSPYINDYLAQSSVFSGGYAIYDLIVFPVGFGQIRYYIDDDPNDSVKRTLKTGYAYEGNLSLMIDELVKPETIAIDMGAHIGVHTIFMSRKAGPLGAVIAFEPNPKLYMELLANLELNSCKNVISICKGLGKEASTVYQHRIEIEQNDPLEGDGDPIEIVPLDSYYFNSVSLIKMDVENYEYFILQGARETILRNKPVILFETWVNYEPQKRNQEFQRKNFENVMALVESYGYEIYIVYNCDFLAIPIRTEDETLLKYKRRLRKLDPKTYQGEPL
ncbi:MAG: hypothetical protein A3E80_05610 [Chlamydiae bacterium RIFCSPHIGHO2_12_FULL_49_9]|nr:MAG: hypothetical protein A3E80_05610 [Chlamydiae bacterium RIFCSPHIGHO2_12_FULL_49_9]